MLTNVKPKTFSQEASHQTARFLSTPKDVWAHPKTCLWCLKHHFLIFAERICQKNEQTDVGKCKYKAVFLRKLRTKPPDFWALPKMFEHTRIHVCDVWITIFYFRLESVSKNEQTDVDKCKSKNVFLRKLRTKPPDFWAPPKMFEHSRRHVCDVWITFLFSLREFVQNEQTDVDNCKSKNVFSGSFAPNRPIFEHTQRCLSTPEDMFVMSEAPFFLFSLREFVKQRTNWCWQM